MLDWVYASALQLLRCYSRDGNAQVLTIEAPALGRQI